MFVTMSQELSLTSITRKVAEMEETLDKIIHKLKEIEINADVMSWEDIASWTDVVSWISKEIEKNQELKNVLKDIIIDLEEHKEANKIENKLKKI